MTSIHTCSQSTAHHHIDVNDGGLPGCNLASSSRRCYVSPSSFLHVPRMIACLAAVSAGGLTGGCRWLIPKNDATNTVRNFVRRGEQYAEMYHHSSCTSSYVFYLGTSTSMTSQTEHIYANVGNPNFFCVTLHERRPTYNLALRPAHVTSAAVIKQEVLHTLSVCL